MPKVKTSQTKQAGLENKVAVRSGRVQKTYGTPGQSSNNSPGKVLQPPTADGIEAANTRGGKARKKTLLRRLKQIEEDHPQDCATLKASHYMCCKLVSQLALHTTT